MTHNPETVERVAFLRQLHSNLCYEQGDHEDEVDTAYSAGADAIEQLAALPPQEVSVQDAAKVLLAACPNPIFDKLKGPLIGEFSQQFPFFNEDGEEVHADVNISWVVTKKIIAAALRALSEDTQ